MKSQIVRIHVIKIILMLKCCAVKNYIGDLVQNPTQTAQ